MAQGDMRGEGRTDRNPARNLTHEDRVRGGRNSAAQQTRDAHGQFAGRRTSATNRAEAEGGPGSPDRGLGREEV